MSRLLAVVAVVSLVGCGGTASRSSNSATSPSLDAFAALLHRGERAALRVSYREEGNSQMTSGASDSGAAGLVFTFASDGKNRSAYAVLQTLIIDDGHAETMCTGLDSRPRCDRVAATYANAAQAERDAYLSAASDVVDSWRRARQRVTLSNRVIATRIALCLTQKTKGTLTVCVDRTTGAFLGEEGGSALTGTYGLIATKVANVVASDFRSPTKPGDHWGADG